MFWWLIACCWNSRAARLVRPQEVLPIHKAQLLSYMKLLNVPVGLLINFHEVKLVDGIHRLVLRGGKPMTA